MSIHGPGERRLEYWNIVHRKDDSGYGGTSRVQRHRVYYRPLLPRKLGLFRKTDPDAYVEGPIVEEW